MRSANIRYLPELDHLRAGAALLIIFYHGFHLFSGALLRRAGSTVPGWFGSRNPFLTFIIEGHTAVALFIVLSGFIFTFGALDHEIDYWKFIKNRALRIYPLFLVLLFVGIYSTPGSFDFSYFIQTVCGLSNVQRGSHFPPFSDMFWTIAVEVQFYLFFPFLLSILNRRGAKALLGLLVIANIFRWCAWMEHANIRDLTHFTIVGRIDQFLLGMLAAVYYRKRFHTGRSWDLGFGLALGLLGLTFFLFNRSGGWPAQTPWKIVWPALEGLLWAFLMLSYLSFARHLPAVVSRGLAAFGTISYSLYLLHMSVIRVAIDSDRISLIKGLSVEGSALVWTAIILPAVLVFAAMNYNFIERPFLEMRVTYKKAL